MLGFRGCRLAIAFPEIAEMQARAIFEGAVDAKRKTGQAPAPEIMVPLVAIKPEFDARQGDHRRDAPKPSRRKPARRSLILSAR